MPSDALYDSWRFHRGPFATEEASVVFAWGREDGGRFLRLTEAQQQRNRASSPRGLSDVKIA